MVLSHGKKYLYFVVPKCGSTTVRHVLEPYTDVGYPVSHYHMQHLTIEQFLETEYKSCFNEYFKFTFVRNPYDRIYSGFMQDLYASKNYPRWIECKAPIFKEIGEDFNRYIQEYVREQDLSNDWRWVCFRPMHMFSHMNNSSTVDFVGRTETLTSDINRLCQLLKIENPQSYTSYNVNQMPSPTYKYLDKYDVKSIEIINEIYHRDFVEFGYIMIDPSYLRKTAA